MFGVWAPGEEVAKLTYFGLYALQHRGQESAGIAVSNGSQIMVFKDMGLVSQVFDESTLSSLRGAPRHRSRPLLHHRSQRLEERPADLPAHRHRRHRARPQRQPDQHPRAAELADRAGRPGGLAGPRRSVARGDQRHLAGSPRCWRPTPADHRAGRAGGAAAPQGRLQPGLHGRGDAVRGPRPAGRPAAGAGPARARLGRGQRDRGAGHRRRLLRPRGRSRRADLHRRRRAAEQPVRRSRPQGLPLRVRLPGPARHHDQRPPPALGAGRGRSDPGPGVPGRGRPGHPGARVRHPGGDRLRGGSRGSRTGRAWSRTPTSVGPSSSPARRSVSSASG